jgi:hypothetical protein
MSPVERIPILGRTGPDITINEAGLVIDVKSRLECPKSFFVKEPTCLGTYFSVPLHAMNFFYYEEGKFFSKLVDAYWKHMDQWTQEKMPNGITAVILHRPRVAYLNSVIIFHRKDLRRFQQIWKQHPNKD